MTADKPRIAPGSRSEIGVLNTMLSRLGARATGTRTANLFTTLGRRRRMFKTWLLFAGTLMPGGKLPRRETELAILRVASLRDCAYELEHHLRLGRRAGLTTVELENVQQRQLDLSQWGVRDAALLRAIDALVTDKDIDDALWAQLVGQFDAGELVEVTMLVGHYDMLATFIGTLRIQPDLRRG